MKVNIFGYSLTNECFGVMFIDASRTFFKFFSWLFPKFGSPSRNIDTSKLLNENYKSPQLLSKLIRSVKYPRFSSFRTNP